MRTKEQKQHVELVSTQSPLKKIALKSIPLLLLVLIVVTIFELTQKHNNLIVYTIYANEYGSISNLLKKIDEHKTIITPGNVQLPFSNFHNIENVTLSKIRDRLIDEDPRLSQLITKLLNYFYPIQSDNRETIRLITTDVPSKEYLQKALHNLKLEYTTKLIATANKKIISGIVFIVIALVSLLLVKSRQIRNQTILYIAPWIIIQCFMFSGSFGLLILCVETLMYGFLLFKPFGKKQQRIFLAQSIKYLLAPAVVVLILAVMEPMNIILSFIASVFSCLLYWLSQKIKKKDHCVPIFTIIVPKQPFWMSRNKHIVLVSSLYLLTTVLLSRNTINPAQISEDDILAHYEKQLYTINGSVYTAYKQKPILKETDGRVSVGYITVSQQNPQDVSITTKNELKVFLASVSFSNNINAFLMLATVFIVLFLAFDVIITAGKNIGIVIHSNSSRNARQQEIRISATDVTI